MRSPVCMDRPPPGAPPRWLRLVTAALAGAALGGCIVPNPASLPVGMRLAQVRHDMGAPTGSFESTAGGQVLEYATGPFGKTTHFLRFDADGRLLAAEQVLDEAHFDTVRVGMSSDQVRRLIGRPSTTFAVARPPQTVWAYRFESWICRWFMVGIGADAQVMDTSYGPDPACEVHDLDIR